MLKLLCIMLQATDMKELFPSRQLDVSCSNVIIRVPSYEPSTAQATVLLTGPSIHNGKGGI